MDFFLGKYYLGKYPSIEHKTVKEHIDAIEMQYDRLRGMYVQAQIACTQKETYTHASTLK